MLPKVANHLLHQTARVVSAVPNAGLRNLIPNPSAGNVTNWTGVGTSGSGGYGAGPGGAKYHAGSRFNGYTGSGRALTQANPSTAIDGTNVQDDEERPPLAKRPTLIRSPTVQPRSRSHSISAGTSAHSRQERGLTLGVLESVQMHARHRHAFAAPNSSTSADHADSLSRPVITRRNSTSTPNSSVEHRENLDRYPPPPVPTSSTGPSSTTEPSTPQRVTEPRDVTSQTLQPPHNNLLTKLRDAGRLKNESRVLDLVQKLVHAEQRPLTQELNAALEALRRIRRPGDTLTTFLDVYNSQVARGVVPNARTYELVIGALTDRDVEVHKVLVDLESRISRPAAGQNEAENQDDIARMQLLTKETNLTSAMKMFHAATTLGLPLAIPAFENLLESCAINSNIEAALDVFDHLERRLDLKPSAISFLHLLSVFVNLKDIHGAKEVFTEFVNAGKENRLPWSSDMPSIEAAQDHRIAHIKVYNKMIEANFRCDEPDSAIGLLSQMIDSTAPVAFGPNEIPLPSASTYTHVIAGFCRSGDVQSALSWFDKLLEQNQASRHPYEPSKTPYRPDRFAWATVLDTLAVQGMVDELNAYFAKLLECADRDGIAIRPADRMTVFHANAQALQQLQNEISDEDALRRLEFMHTIVLANVSLTSTKDSSFAAKQLAKLYFARGYALQALEVTSSIVHNAITVMRRASGSSWEARSDIRNSYQELVSSVGNTLLQSPELTASASYLMMMKMLWRLNDVVGSVPDANMSSHFRHAIAGIQNRAEYANFSIRDWEILLSVCAPSSSAADADRSLHASRVLIAMRDTGVDLSQIHSNLLRLAIDSLGSGLNLASELAKLGPEYEEVLSDLVATSETGSETVTSPGPSPIPVPDSSLQLDATLSSQLEEILRTRRKGDNSTLTKAAELVKTNFSHGRCVQIRIIRQLLNDLGRAQAMSSLEEIYGIAHASLGALSEAEARSGWQDIENVMVSASAHAGDLDAAFAHRARITEHGFVPTAESYGALIECVRDTTDDTSNAMAIYAESQTVGCVPSTYLYNNMISKLAKARKADFALEIFQQMKNNAHTQPTVVTYGAVIAACARVGDAASAEQLFTEMEACRFRPAKIPPYNTMIQFYTNTKPNRERALFFYNKMLRAGITPTAHTYKLLIDIHGTIEPVNTEAMEQEFDKMSRVMPPQGTHWAGLINSYGCAQKDLAKAITVFDSIHHHPSTIQHRSRLPDAIVYEALFLAIVTHKQMHLVSGYLSRMKSENIHMTAYIANLLIKGHALVDDIEAARAVFEALEDPAQGVAAPNNHAIKGDAAIAIISAQEPCYREPSTWEAMIRAEYGSGYRNRVDDLLVRMKERKFPAGVVKRITGIINGSEEVELRASSADLFRPTF